MNAFMLLKSDHVSIGALFDKYRATTGLWQKEELAIKLVKALSAHIEVENRLVVTPAIKQMPSLKTQVQQFFDAQALIRTMIQPEEQPPVAPQTREEQLDAKMKAIEDCYRPCVEFEESEMFPRLRAVLDPSQLECLEVALANAREVTAA